MMKRAFDITFSLFGLIILSPLILIISLLIILDSKGGVFFKQQRVGKNGRLFYIYKFRTMKPESEKSGQLTIGKKDQRVTRIGYFLRKYKLDELPQLINVLKGDMSFVGPRPEVPKYVALYNNEQRKILSVKPGITDYASIEYIDENEILGNSPHPEETYIKQIMPEKIRLNLKYINEKKPLKDIKIILLTLRKIIR